jgi:hypothetical protein
VSGGGNGAGGTPHEKRGCAAARADAETVSLWSDESSARNALAHSSKCLAASS